MARRLAHLRRLLIIPAILIPLVLIARPAVRAFEAPWYRFVERRERWGDRSTATNSTSSTAGRRGGRDLGPDRGTSGTGPRGTSDNGAYVWL
jgi:hypothetical protein